MRLSYNGKIQHYFNGSCGGTSKILLLTRENFVSGNLSGKHRLAVKTERSKTQIMYFEFVLVFQTNRLGRNI
jgi:hypothetical protein